MSCLFTPWVSAARPEVAGPEVAERLRPNAIAGFTDLLIY